MKNSFLLLAGPLLLAGCTLAADDVEPALPAVPVYGTNTVVYRLNGRPVVAHNAGTVISAVFGGNRYPPVYIFFGPDSSLVFRSADAQNQGRDGSATHELEWALPRFRGLGRYRPDPAQTTFQRREPGYDSATAPYVAPQTLDGQQPAEVVVTRWDPATRQMGGTFVLHFAAQGAAPAAALTEGAFDLKPGF